MFKSIFGIVFLVFMVGCGTTSQRLINWDDQHLHRIGPDTSARLYFYDDKKDTWVLSDEKFAIPEGMWLVPNPPREE